MIVVSHKQDGFTKFRVRLEKREFVLFWFFGEEMREHRCVVEAFDTEWQDYETSRWFDSDIRARLWGYNWLLDLAGPEYL